MNGNYKGKKLCETINFFPSRVSDRGYGIGPVCVSVSALPAERLAVAMCGMSVLEGLWGKNGTGVHCKNWAKSHH